MKNLSLERIEKLEIFPKTLDIKDKAEPVNVQIINIMQ